MWTNHRSYPRYNFDSVFACIIFTMVIFFQLSHCIHLQPTFGQIFSIIAIDKLSINSGCTLYAFFCCVSVACFMWRNCKSYCILFLALSVNEQDRSHKKQHSSTIDLWIDKWQALLKPDIHLLCGSKTKYSFLMFSMTIAITKHHNPTAKRHRTFKN